MTSNRYACLVNRRHERVALDRVLVLDWYDAVVSGLIRACPSGAWFLACLVSWDMDKRQRVYASIPISAELSEVVASKALAPPSWPLWVPQLRAKHRAEAETQIYAARQDLPDDVCLLLTDRLENGILAARVVPVTAVGRWMMTASIDEVVEQTDDERIRIFGLLTT